MDSLRLSPFLARASAGQHPTQRAKMGSSMLFMATVCGLQRLLGLAERTNSWERWERQSRQDGIHARWHTAILLPKLLTLAAVLGASPTLPGPPPGSLPSKQTPSQDLLPTSPNIPCSHLRRKRD